MAGSRITLQRKSLYQFYAEKDTRLQSFAFQEKQLSNMDLPVLIDKHQI